MTDLKPQPTMVDFQQYIADVCKERGWDVRTPMEKMVLMTEEVGEVAEALRREAGIGSKKPDNTDHLAEELVDVSNYLCDIANDFHIDLEQAFRDKWKKNASRSWEGHPAPTAKERDL